MLSSNLLTEGLLPSAAPSKAGNHYYTAAQLNMLSRKRAASRFRFAISWTPERLQTRLFFFLKNLAVHMRPPALKYQIAQECRAFMRRIL